MTDGLTLRDVRAEFPQYAIWRDVTPARTRYHAQRVRPCIQPYAVVTASLGELRAELAKSGEPQEPAAPAGTDTSVANIARMYDYWLGGCFL